MPLYIVSLHFANNNVNVFSYWRMDSIFMCFNYDDYDINYIGYKSGMVFNMEGIKKRI